MYTFLGGDHIWICFANKLPAAADPASLGPQFDHEGCGGPLSIKEENQLHQDIWSSENKYISLYN